MQIRTPKDIGNQIRHARKQQSMTQTGLAKKVGVTLSWISEVENGHPRAELELVLRTLATLGIVLTSSEQHDGNHPAPAALETYHDDLGYPDLDDIVGGGPKP
jgi:y4mF family transcriptional regulator